jgi:cytochrome c oxidase subunit III
MPTAELVRDAPNQGGTAPPPWEAVRHRGGDGGGGLIGDPARFGLWLFLATVSMLFIGFTSAYLVRRASGDWLPMRPPMLLWLNTAVLAASSATLEVSRRRLAAWDLTGTRRFLAGTGLLGAAFVAGQGLAWRELVARGYYLASNPHNSFFYVLTGMHALHLVSGLIWFCAVYYRVQRLALTPGEDGLRLFATYWHFLGGLWLYLLLLLFVL